MDPQDHDSRAPDGTVAVKPDPVDFIEDVRAARARVCAKYGNDLDRIFDALRAREREHPDKVVRRVKHVSYTVEPAFETTGEDAAE